MEGSFYSTELSKVSDCLQSILRSLGEGRGLVYVALRMCGLCYRILPILSKKKKKIQFILVLGSPWMWMQILGRMLTCSWQVPSHTHPEARSSKKPQEGLRCDVGSSSAGPCSQLSVPLPSVKAALLEAVQSGAFHSLLSPGDGSSPGQWCWV